LNCLDTFADLCPGMFKFSSFAYCLFYVGSKLWVHCHKADINVWKNFDTMLPLLQVGYTPDYLFLLQTILRSDPQVYSRGVHCFCKQYPYIKGCIPCSILLTCFSWYLMLSVLFVDAGCCELCSHDVSAGRRVPSRL
jgi:hypothetical protein